MPTVVYVSCDKTLVGEQALEKCEKEPLNCIFGLNSMLSGIYNENNTYITSQPSFVNQNGILTFQIKCRAYNQDIIKTFSIEELYALVIVKMKKFAEKSVNKKISSAAFTIPSNFTVLEERNLRKAASRSGVNVI